MKKVVILLGLAAGLIMAGIPLGAHHSFQAEYDQTKPLTLKGVVTQVQQTNPHGWIFLDAKPDKPEGKTINWALETPPPNLLRQNGFGTEVYQQLASSKEEVSITAYAAKDGSKHAWAGSMTRADGRTVITLSGIPGQGGGGGRGGGQGNGGN